MSADNRTERIAAALEQRFEDCSRIAQVCVTEGEKQPAFTEWHLRSTALFLKTSAEIAGVIARLEAQGARDREALHAQRQRAIKKYSGSIP
jgi:hypothetical protein